MGHSPLTRYHSPLTLHSFELDLVFLRHLLADLAGGLLDILPGFGDYRIGRAGRLGNHVARHTVIIDAGGVARGAIAISPAIAVTVVGAARRHRNHSFAHVHADALLSDVDVRRKIAHTAQRRADR